VHTFWNRNVQADANTAATQWLHANYELPSVDRRGPFDVIPAAGPQVGFIPGSTLDLQRQRQAADTAANTRRWADYEASQAPTPVPGVEDIEPDVEQYTSQPAQTQWEVYDRSTDRPVFRMYAADQAEAWRKGQEWVANYARMTPDQPIYGIDYSVRQSTAPVTEGRENDNPVAQKIFFARSDKAPDGWSYDHVGFITRDGRQIQMSGHKGNDVYVTNTVTDDPEFPEQKIKIVSLSKPVSVPTTNAVGAENCGTFVAKVLQANGIKGITTQKIYSVFKQPHKQDVSESREITKLHKLDSVLEKCIDMIRRGHESDPERYGRVAACLIDNKNNHTYAINMPGPDGTRRHAERMAIDKHLKSHGRIGPNAIMITTLSPCVNHMDERYGESCTDLLSDYGIEKCYAGWQDPTQHPAEDYPFNLKITDNMDIFNTCRDIAASFLPQAMAEAYTGPPMKFLKPGELSGSYSPQQMQAMGFKQSSNGSWYIPMNMWQRLVSGGQIREGAPQPGKSSGKPISWTDPTKVETKYLTLDEILKSIPGIPYYNDVVNDRDKKDFTWGVTKRVIQYAKELIIRPDTYKNWPPIIVLDGKLQDGAHRISTMYLMQQRVQPNNPTWKNAELKVEFGTSDNVKQDGRMMPRAISVPPTFPANTNARGGGVGLMNPDPLAQLMREENVEENFADGRNPQDKGDSKRHGINTRASVSSLRKTAKSGGRKGQLAHWLANMKAGRAKAKRKTNEDSEFVDTISPGLVADWDDQAGQIRYTKNNVVIPYGTAEYNAARAQHVEYRKNLKYNKLKQTTDPIYNQIRGAFEKEQQSPTKPGAAISVPQELFPQDTIKPPVKYDDPTDDDFMAEDHESIVEDTVATINLGGIIVNLDDHALDRQQQRGIDDKSFDSAIRKLKLPRVIKQMSQLEVGNRFYVLDHTTNVALGMRKIGDAKYVLKTVYVGRPADYNIAEIITV